MQSVDTILILSTLDLMAVSILLLCWLGSTWLIETRRGAAPPPRI